MATGGGLVAMVTVEGGWFPSLGREPHSNGGGGREVVATATEGCPIVMNGGWLPWQLRVVP